MESNRRYDAVVIGSGLGGLTAAALLGKSGNRVCVVERNRSFGGAASCYRVGGLTIEASLHETADPRDPRDLKHAILERLGLLDKIEWLPVPDLHTVVGGPVGAPLVLPHGFDPAANALADRFPVHAAGIRRVLSRMSGIYDTLGELAAAGDRRSLGALLRLTPGLAPILRDWRMSLAQAFARDLGDCEGAKCTLASNLPYYDDDPRRTWWIFFAVAQGGYLGSGGVYVRGGSTRLSRSLAKVVKEQGGEILLGRKAVRIELGPDGRPNCVHHVGQEGQDTDRIETRVVLANCSPYAVGNLIPLARQQGFLNHYRGLQPSISLFSAHFGLNKPPERFGLRGYSTILLPDWMTRLDDYAQASMLLGALPTGRMPPLTVVNYGAVDAKLDATETTLVSVVGVDRVAHWDGLDRRQDLERRSAWMDAILQTLESHYPGFSGAVTGKVFISARSIQDYLGTPAGAVYGFAPTPPERYAGRGFRRSPQTPVPGLFLASSFAGCGGFTGAMGAGASAALLAEKDLKKV